MELIIGLLVIVIVLLIFIVILLLRIYQKVGAGQKGGMIA